MHCNNGLNNKLVESLVENKVAQETGDLKYLQDSMYDFVKTLKEIILGEYSPEFFNKYVDEALKLHGSNLEEFLKIPKMGLELRQALESIDEAIDISNQEFRDNLVLLLDRFQTTLDNIEYEARDPYDTAVELGYRGTKQEWLKHLEGDSAYEIAVKNGYKGTQAEWLKYIRADGYIQSIQQFATNDAKTKVQIPDYGTINSLQGFIKELFTNNGIADRFKTISQLETEGTILEDGSYALVADDGDNNGLYLKNSGIWVRSEYDPVVLSNKYTDKMLDPVSIESNNTDDADLLSFTDSDYKVIAKIDSKLTAHFKAINCDSISTAGVEVYDEPSTDNQLTITDGVGRIIELYDSNGNHKSINNSGTAPKVDEPQPRMITDIFHIAGAGQSLSLGVGSEKRITKASEAVNALIPNKGMLDGQPDTEGVSGVPLLSNSLIAFDPSVDRYPNYEAPILATTAYLQQTFDSKGVASQVLPSNHGHGSWEIAQLEKGTPSFTVGIEQSKKYKEYASNMGKSLLTQFVLWFQGETDITRGYSQQYYLDKLRQLAKDYRQDMAQGVDPILLTYQTGSYTKRGPNSSPKVPYAQLQAANIDPYIKMVCPTYMMSYTDGVHMKANSYRWMGCYFGKVIDWMLENNRTDWKPLQPERIIRTGKVVTIEFHVPVKPLVIDTNLVSNPGNYGFTVKDTAGSTLAINSVSVVGGDKVNIVLTSTPSNPVIVSYGLGVIGNNAGATTGSRGNLRDSDNTDSLLLDESGKKYTLYNWCVLFTQQEGFLWEQ